jgi:hypothetical protein
MTLSQFVSEKRQKAFEELKKGLAPSEGSYSEAILRDAKSKGAPQLGATRHEPNAVLVEFIYPVAGSSATVLTITLDAPERIVFMPVPSWVVESIWQGEIDGSFHFESEANFLVAELQGQLAPEANLKLFGPKDPTRRG